MKLGTVNCSLFNLTHSRYSLNIDQTLILFDKVPKRCALYGIYIYLDLLSLVACGCVKIIMMCYLNIILVKLV